MFMRSKTINHLKPLNYQIKLDKCKLLYQYGYFILYFVFK